ncbi:PA domain containing zinc finger, C3HC4 RING-type protein [Rhodotorula toruloides]|uniref:RING-type E3 ubiquitin transferase n=1 Tax=Rhodotorula toruloides TaxID=5286 RepID=A0A511KNR2_RHOTO|nr:PA domain containing zinc finger, C3HC4 RING-type protein [Rhodotorula toruloides]
MDHSTGLAGPPPAPRRRFVHHLPALVAVGIVLFVAFAGLSGDEQFSESVILRRDAADSALHVQRGGRHGDSDASRDDAGRSTTRQLRVGLAGAGSGQGRQSILLADEPKDELAFAVQHSSPPARPHFHYTGKANSRKAFWRMVSAKLDGLATSVGDLILGLFGFDEDEWFDIEGEGGADAFSLEGGGLSTWSESSIYVERSNSLHPSRPSSFGPHIVNEPLRGLLFPIEIAAPTDNYGCTAKPVAPAPFTPSTPWIALVQRGQCPFSDKVRVAQNYGAVAVVFGDESEAEGGISGGHGLLTPWSPDNTVDITIPSVFISRASYVSLLRTWNDEQEIAKAEPPTIEDGSTQTKVVLGDDVDAEQPKQEYVGLEVVLSKEEMLAWPLLDLLFILLFLPSLLTLVTVFIQRVRAVRAQKAERAPKDAVARLPVFRWGESEKPTSPAPKVGGEAARTGTDEEREVGIAHVPISTAPEPTEQTSLLHSQTTLPSCNTSFAHRLTSRLPTSISRHLPASLRPPDSPTQPKVGPPPFRRYPSITECPFCLCDFEPGDLVMSLPCGHLFHAQEVTEWLEEQKGVCPVCRMSVLAHPQEPGAAALIAEGEARAADHAGEEGVPVLSPTDGASVLIQPPARPSSHTASTEPSRSTSPVGVRPHPLSRQQSAASPVASSSSVPIGGPSMRD